LSHGIRPPFEMTRVAAGIDRIVAGGGRRFHLGHGGPIGASEARHADRLRQVVPSMPRPQRMARGLGGAQ
jgi:hydroxyacylglutathione hydrolase